MGVGQLQTVLGGVRWADRYMDGRDATPPGLVEQAASNQLTLHLTKLFADHPPLGRVAPTRFQLVFVELPMTVVRRRDASDTRVGFCASAGSTMQPAAATLLVGRTLARIAPAGSYNVQLPRPLRSKPPFVTDCHIVFYQH